MLRAQFWSLAQSKYISEGAQKWTLLGSKVVPPGRPVFGPFILSDVLKLCKLLCAQNFKLEATLTQTASAAGILNCMRRNEARTHGTLTLLMPGQATVPVAKQQYAGRRDQWQQLTRKPQRTTRGGKEIEESEGRTKDKENNNTAHSRNRAGQTNTLEEVTK